MSETIQTLYNSFTLNKEPTETLTLYNIRKQAICNALNKNQNNFKKIDEIVKLSHYYIAIKVLGCQYSSDIQLSPYFG